ncbi:hypothetical protein [Thiolapillus sp.]|uniref:hypothetical protein n=1 Tax=Thiolapillus sp. TaxID=2017437 RepID=UPI0025D92DEE|nr:hypothetical protein [Thiolapillus sp.]
MALSRDALFSVSTDSLFRIDILQFQRKSDIKSSYFLTIACSGGIVENALKHLSNPPATVFGIDCN